VCQTVNAIFKRVSRQEKADLYGYGEESSVAWHYSAEADTCGEWPGSISRSKPCHLNALARISSVNLNQNASLILFSSTHPRQPLSVRPSSPFFSSRASFFIFQVISVPPLVLYISPNTDALTPDASFPAFLARLPIPP